MEEEVTNDPMQRGQQPSPMHLSARCGARTRKGTPCRSPVVKGKRRCRMHGAHAGPPEGNRNAWKHGGRSAEALAFRRAIRELLCDARELVEKLRPDDR